ncbi:MAG TPA: hypothetical protein VJ302_04470 [Blastocatellia bacterium]|nr:hypothetical protein [Blastocatellia bacterium]
MGKSICVAVLMVLVSGLAQAQVRRAQVSADEDRQFQLYVLAGLGHTTGALNSNRFQIGGGADVLVYKGISLGGEYSRATAAGTAVNGFDIFSANGSYHFLNGAGSGRIDPFATGGYSRFSRAVVDSNAVNFGGGVNVWLSDKLGVRFDLRDHVMSNSSFVGLRGGLVLGF